MCTLDVCGKTPHEKQDEHMATCFHSKCYLETCEQGDDTNGGGDNVCDNAIVV